MMDRFGWAGTKVPASHGGGPIVATVRHTFWLLTLPFRLVAVIWRLAVALGVGVVRFGLNLIAAALGLTVLLFVGFCLTRVVLHPLFLR